MVAFARERHDAFLDAFLLWTIVSFLLSIVLIKVWPYAFPASSFRSHALLFIGAFNGVEGLAYLILVFYAWFYFRRQGFDSRAMVIPNAYLLLVSGIVVLSALVVVPIILEVHAWTMPDPVNLGLGILAWLIGAGFVIYALWLRKTIKPSHTQRIGILLLKAFAALIIGAALYSMIIKPMPWTPPTADVPETSLLNLFVADAAAALAIWYAVHTITNLRAPKQNKR